MSESGQMSHLHTQSMRYKTVRLQHRCEHQGLVGFGMQLVSNGTAIPVVVSRCSANQLVLVCLQADAQEPSSPPSMAGSCHLSPQAAAALHFWLSHSAVSPHMQATYLHNMHAGMTHPSRAFPGVSLLLLPHFWHVCRQCSPPTSTMPNASLTNPYSTFPGVNLLLLHIGMYEHM